MSWAGLPDITAQSFQPICGKGVGGWNLFARAAARQYQRHEIRDEVFNSHRRHLLRGLAMPMSPISGAKRDCSLYNGIFLRLRRPINLEDARSGPSMRRP